MDMGMDVCYLWSCECMQYIGAIPRVFIQTRHTIGANLKV